MFVVELTSVEISVSSRHGQLHWVMMSCWFSAKNRKKKKKKNKKKKSTGLRQLKQSIIAAWIGRFTLRDLHIEGEFPEAGFPPGEQNAKTALTRKNCSESQRPQICSLLSKKKTTRVQENNTASVLYFTTVKYDSNPRNELKCDSFIGYYILVLESLCEWQWHKVNDNDITAPRVWSGVDTNMEGDSASAICDNNHIIFIYFGHLFTFTISSQALGLQLTGRDWI